MLLRVRSWLSADRTTWRRRIRRGLAGVALALGVIVLVSGVGMWRCYRSGRGAPPEREVRDVTQLVRLPVDQVVRPRSTAEVERLVAHHDGPISIGGGRFSMGGQIGTSGTLFLDLREMDDVIALDATNRRVTVEAGIIWRKIQEAIDPHDLSLDIMQSYANFTVGGSMSVNAHGRYVGRGPVAQSVVSFDLVLADGSRVHTSRTERPELFHGAIGGYGGLGVITEVTLALAVNEPIERGVARMPIGDFRTWFDAEIRGSPSVLLFNADLYPPAYDELAAVTFSRTDRAPTVPDRLQPVGEGSSKAQRFAYWFVSEAPLAKEARAEVIERWKLAGQPVVWRNYEASYDARELEPGSREASTYVLQEYFLPVDRFEAFAVKMAEIFQRYRANVINVSVRHAEADPDTLLTWAPTERFAFVVYYKQETSEAAKTEVGVWTRELIEAALSEYGTYYLPYQLHATDDQFRQAYPRAGEWFQLKMQVDPQYHFRNALWDKYFPPADTRTADPTIAGRLRNDPAYVRPEDQTLLTVPEWYIVYSAEELGAALDKRPPSAFPYLRSVCQFCAVYGAVSSAIGDRWPNNTGYHAMIWVIGASFAGEYALKGAYESTIGRLSEWVGGTSSPQDQFYADYTQQYAAFMHHTPWYAFPFAEARGRMPAGGGLRGLERRLAIGAELTAKSWWGWAMGGTSQAAYGAETDRIRAWVRPRGADLSAIPGIAPVEPLGNGEVLVAMQRYEPFTAAVQALVAEGAELVEVAGGHTIVVQLLVPAAWSDAGLWGDVVFSWPILTDPAHRRIAIEVPVRRLHEILPALAAEPVTVEHIYDY